VADTKRLRRSGCPKASPRMSFGQTWGVVLLGPRGESYDAFKTRFKTTGQRRLILTILGADVGDISNKDTPGNLLRGSSEEPVSREAQTTALDKNTRGCRKNKAPL